MSLKPVVVDYIKKYQKFSTRALAKALLKDHPAEFKDYTSARNAVRYARGEIYKRKVMDENADLMSKKAKAWRKDPNFTLPESDAEEWLPIEVGQGVGKMGFMIIISATMRNGTRLFLRRKPRNFWECQSSSWLIC